MIAVCPDLAQALYRAILAGVIKVQINEKERTGNERTAGDAGKRMPPLSSWKRK
jgi:hypothetical protein